MKNIRVASFISLLLLGLVYLISWKNEMVQSFWAYLLFVGRDAHSPNMIQGIILMYLICWVVALGLILGFRSRQSSRDSPKE